HGACGAPETSAPQCPHALASTSRRCVGFGCNGRCAPGCGFFLRRLFTNSVVFLWPWLGGTLELFGVFGGRSCLACRRATSASRLVTFAIKRSFDSASAKATPSSPSRSSESNAFRFIGSVNHTLILRSMAQVNGAKTLLLNDRFQKTGVSNYLSDYQWLYIEPRETGSELKNGAVLSYLLDKGVFRAGLNFECPSCRLEFWRSLDDARSRLECEYCGHGFNAAPQLRDKAWAFRRSGLLGNDDHQEGAIPVLLTLQQLMLVHSMSHGVFTTAMKLNP